MSIESRVMPKQANEGTSISPAKLYRVLQCTLGEAKACLEQLRMLVNLCSNEYEINKDVIGDRAEYKLIKMGR